MSVVFEDIDKFSWQNFPVEKRRSGDNWTEVNWVENVFLRNELYEFQLRENQVCGTLLIKMFYVIQL